MFGWIKRLFGLDQTVSSSREITQKDLEDPIVCKVLYETLITDMMIQFIRERSSLDNSNNREELNLTEVK